MGIRSLWADVRALLRGERRIAAGLRGRTHARKGNDGDLLASKAKAQLTIKVKHIIEAETGLIYTQEEWMKKNG